MRGFLPFPVGLQLKEDVGCAILVERAGKEDEISQDYPGLSAKAIYSLNTSV